MEVSSTGDVKKELTGRARRKMSKMSKQPASVIVEEDSDARLNVSEVCFGSNAQSNTKNSACRKKKKRT